MRRLSIRNMSKSFAGSKALSNVSLDIAAGEVHGLMGENGAGKSTLIKILAGVLPADTLDLVKDGAALPLTTAQDAHAAGFRFIHQELNIVRQLSVAENISLGLPYPRRFGVAVDWPALRRRADAALARLGVRHIDATQQAARLTTGDQMLMKIAGALVSDDGATAQLYVLDEPTAALTGAESEKLFQVIAELKGAGAAILYVTHRMNEVMAICDRVTVLRDGANVFTAPVAATTKQQIIAAMTGRAVADTYPPRTRTPGTPGSPGTPGAAVVCQAANVSTRQVRGLNFELRAGEILGIAGLADAGQSDVLGLFLGLSPVTSGDLRFAGEPAPRSPAAAWRRNIAYLPKERRGQGLMLRMAVRDNTVLPHLAGLARFGVIADRRAERAKTDAAAQVVRLKYAAADQPVYQLSGGNQQKVVFARALGAKPALLLLDEPTRGVDVGAKFDIYSLVRRLSGDGCAVILTSSDLPEMLAMCDRLLIMRDRAQYRIIDAAGVTPAQLLAQFYDTQAA